MLRRKLVCVGFITTLLQVFNLSYSIAQIPPVDPAQPVITATPAATGIQVAGSQQVDTVQAIHYLFENRRRGGRLFTGMGGLGVISIGLTLAMPTSNSSPSLYAITAADKRLLAGVLAMETLSLLGVGISKVSRFSKAKEEALILQYQAGGAVPAAIRQRLRPKYFRVWPTK